MFAVDLPKMWPTYALDRVYLGAAGGGDNMESLHDPAFGENGSETGWGRGVPGIQ